MSPQLAISVVILVDCTGFDQIRFPYLGLLFQNLCQVRSVYLEVLNSIFNIVMLSSRLYIVLWPTNRRS